MRAPAEGVAGHIPLIASQVNGRIRGTALIVPIDFELKNHHIWNCWK